MYFVKLVDVTYLRQSPESQPLRGRTTAERLITVKSFDTMERLTQFSEKPKEAHVKENMQRNAGTNTLVPVTKIAEK